MVGRGGDFFFLMIGVGFPVEGIKRSLLARLLELYNWLSCLLCGRCWFHFNWGGECVFSGGVRYYGSLDVSFERCLGLNFLPAAY